MGENVFYAGMPAEEWKQIYTRKEENNETLKKTCQSYAGTGNGAVLCAPCVRCEYRGYPEQ